MNILKRMFLSEVYTFGVLVAYKLRLTIRMMKIYESSETTLAAGPLTFMCLVLMCEWSYESTDIRSDAMIHFFADDSP